MIKRISFLLVCGVALFISPSCVDVFEKEKEQPSAPLGITVNIWSLAEESVATGFAELYDKRYFVSGGTSVYSLDNGQWKLSKNLKTPIYDLLVRNDTLFALTTMTINSNGEKIASKGDYFLPANEKEWKKDESEKFVNLSRKIGVTKNSKGVQYRIKENSIIIGGQLRELPSDVEKLENGKWQKLKLPKGVKYKMTNIYIGSDNQRAYVTGPAGSFDDNNNFVPTSDHATVLALFGDL